MHVLEFTNRGRAQSLPVLFSADRAIPGPRDWARLVAFCFAGLRYFAFQVVQSANMQFASQTGDCLSYFADLPPAGTDASQSGPVLVMPPAQKPTRPQRWLQRLWLIVFVLFCLEVGIILTVLPWTPLWTKNSLLMGFPAVKEFFSNNFVRGLVSGLGLIDIWMGVAEAVTYRERP